MLSLLGVEDWVVREELVEVVLTVEEEEAEEEEEEDRLESGPRLHLDHERRTLVHVRPQSTLQCGYTIA